MAALSKAEAAVYDRQIRVWGVDTQQRLNAARVLIAGGGGLVAEVAKNVVLAGAGLVAIMDDTPISAAPGTSFLLPAGASADATVAEVSVASLQEMNPLVKVALVPGSVAAATDIGFVAEYNVVLVVSPSLSVLRRYDEACSAASAAFFGAASRGADAFVFANLHTHTYASTEKQDGVVKGGQLTSQFCSLAEALLTPWNQLKPKRTHELYYGLRVLSRWDAAHQRPPQPGDEAALEAFAHKIAAQAGTNPQHTASAAAALAFGSQELPPVNAVVGGVLANEVLKAISHKGEPVNNFFFYGLGSGVGQAVTGQAAAMGKVPVRLKEVVYTVSPFEVTIMNGLFKDFHKKVQRNLSEKGWDIAFFGLAPVAATMWYAENYREKEKLEHRY